MKIAIGADHRGFLMKAYIKKHLSLSDSTIRWLDVGTHTNDRTDYPIYAKLVVAALEKGEAPIGILLCGSGVGMAVTANRYPGIRAGVAWNSKVATMCKEDDNVTILVIPSDFVSDEESVDIIHHWLIARFKGGRYQDRIMMVDEE